MKEYGIGSNEEILTFERGKDATIRTKAVLLHHIPIPHCVADINVGPEWQCHHRMVKVDEDITPSDTTIDYKVSSFLLLHSDFWYSSLGSACTYHYLLVGTMCLKVQVHQS
jgi:hypothetical protein